MDFFVGKVYLCDANVAFQKYQEHCGRAECEHHDLEARFIISERKAQCAWDFSEKTNRSRHSSPG